MIKTLGFGRRLVALAGDQVSFRWHDYQHHNKHKVMTLAADEFISRFLLHALPDGFHRIVITASSPTAVVPKGLNAAARCSRSLPHLPTAAKRASVLPIPHPI